MKTKHKIQPLPAIRSNRREMRLLELDMLDPLDQERDYSPMDALHSIVGQTGRNAVYILGHKDD